MGNEVEPLRCKCGKPIGPRQVRFNAGLCDGCLQKALRAEAKKLAGKRKRRTSR